MFGRNSFATLPRGNATALVSADPTYKYVDYKQQKNIKIITAQKPEAKIQIRHPGNQGWSRLGGFKYAQLTSINDTNKTLEDLIQVKK